MRPLQHGFTYLGVLAAVAILGIGLAKIGEIFHTVNQRDREAALLATGDEIRRAIGSYYEHPPGTLKTYPAQLKDLLLDARFLTLRRHLRRVYFDPISGKPEWGLVRGPGDAIVGVYSLSADEPIKQNGFPERFHKFEGAKHYSDWRFVYQPAATQQTSPPKTASQ